MESRELDGVAAAFVAPEFELEPMMSDSGPMIGGGSANQTGYKGEGTIIAIVDSGVDLDHEAFRDAPNNAKLNASAVAACLEQYDFNAEAIMPTLTPTQVYTNQKIPYGFDYADKTNSADPRGGSDHGTHVAGIAAANDGLSNKVEGIAPEAQILAMKVFPTAGGGASYDNILAALEDAVLLGANVINLSLGSPCGSTKYDTEDAETLEMMAVFDRVQQHGIDLAVAAGNDYSAAFSSIFGKSHALTRNPDYGNVSSPSTYAASLSVASAEKVGKVESPYLTVDGRNIAYNDAVELGEDYAPVNAPLFRSLAGKSLEYVPAGHGTVEDFSKVNVEGKIALVSRGEINYQEKETNANNAGAIGLLVYDDAPGFIYMSVTTYDIPCAMITQKDGRFLLEQESKILTVAGLLGNVENPVGGQMSDFSSWGTTSDLACLLYTSDAADE